MEQIKTGLSVGHVTLQLVRKEISEIQNKQKAMFVAYMQIMIFVAILAILLVLTSVFYLAPTVFLQLESIANLDITSATTVSKYKLFSSASALSTDVVGVPPVSDTAWCIAVIILGIPAVFQLWAAFLLLTASENRIDLSTTARLQRTRAWTILGLVFFVVDFTVFVAICQFYYIGALVLFIRCCWLHLVDGYKQNLERDAVTLPHAIAISLHK